MSIGAGLLIGGFGLTLALLIWLASTLRTTPAGYTRVGTFDELEVDRVRSILRRAGITSMIDDHSRTLRAGSRIGMIHVFVPTENADEALALLKKESASWLRPAPPA